MTKTVDDGIELTIEEIPAPKTDRPMCSARVVIGRVIPPQQQILLFSADDWEAFIEEWAHHQRTIYQKVTRLSGSKDMGIDIAGFGDARGFEGVWDNFQCKHYGAALTPVVAIPEIGKCLWHAFNRRFFPPRLYSFMAPKDCGMSLKKLLLNASELKAKLIEKWDDWCANEITSTQAIPLEGAFQAYVAAFDFSIFTFKSTLDVIAEHKKTPYHAVRFGGGLPDRPQPDEPPTEPHEGESRYLQQLFGAYSDHKKHAIADTTGLSSWPDLLQHYHRQREVFYHAESLRNFARDNVPPGTFEDLQEEVHAGVIDIEASSHPDAFVRLNAVTRAATQLSITANGLISVTKIQDRRGICHQLANDNRLRWVKP
jgi:hypothetical protein